MNDAIAREIARVRSSGTDWEEVELLLFADALAMRLQRIRLCRIDGVEELTVDGRRPVLELTVDGEQKLEIEVSEQFTHHLIDALEQLSTGEPHAEVGTRPPEAVPHGKVALMCAACGSRAVVDASDTGYRCGVCRDEFRLMSCPFCRRTVTVGSQLFAKRVKCLSCGTQRSWSAWQKRPVRAETLAATYQELDRALLADAHLRKVEGTTIAASGFDPLGEGIGAMLVFTTGELMVLALVEGGYSPVASIEYADVESLQIGGRGALTSTTGGGWMGGGFGVEGIVIGILAAGAMNALTARQTTVIETVIHLKAGTREMLVLTQQAVPEVMQMRLARPCERVRLAHEAKGLEPPQQPNRLEALRQLGELRDSGLLTDSEFEREKAALFPH